MEAQQTWGAVSDLLDKIGKDLLTKMVEAPKTSGNHHFLLDKELNRFYTSFYALKNRQQAKQLSCAVLALTKSGKSTLLNALLGAMVLPSSNVPETARITRIVHTPLQDGEVPQLTYTTSDGEIRRIAGEYGIREHLRYLNREVRTRDYLASDEAYLDVTVPIAALEHAQLGASAVPLQLLDTPGPNEAGEESLKFQVERLLDGVDAVVYILDYTKLKTKEEAELLQKLKDINPQLVARLSQRLFFVVNKVDLVHTSEGLDAAEIKEYVAQLVTTQMATEGFQLHPDQVLLLSAQDAMLSRLVLRGAAGPEERARFGKLAFGARKAASTPDAEYRAAAEEMLAESGLPELEERVLGFLYAHSGALKLLATLDDATRLLHQVRNVAAASNAALQQDVAELQRDAGALQAELADVLDQFDGVQAQADLVETEVVDEVRGRMQALKEQLFEKVNASLQSATTPDEPASSAAGRVASDALAGRWRSVLDRAKRFWEKAGAAGGNALREDLVQPLQDLHHDIHSTIDAEVREFWHELESATNARQAAMFGLLNGHLNRLGGRVEDAVGGLLHVRLEPAALHLEPPSAQQHHADLQALFDSAITPREVERAREGREEVVVWEKRRRRTGLCHYSEYYVGRPSTRAATTTVKETVFDANPGQIREYFMRLVDETVETSVKHVREFVHAILTQRLKQARAAIQDYGQRYTEAMLHALDTHKQGEAARQQAVAQVQRYLATLGALLEATAQLQARADALVPENAGRAAHESTGQECAFEDAAEQVPGPSEVLLPEELGGPAHTDDKAEEEESELRCVPSRLRRSRVEGGTGQGFGFVDAAAEVPGPSGSLLDLGRPLKSAASADSELGVTYWEATEGLAAPHAPADQPPAQAPMQAAASAQDVPSSSPPQAAGKGVPTQADGAFKDLLSAIWAVEDKPAGQRSASAAAAASLDRAINGPSTALAAHQAAAAMPKEADFFSKWSRDDGFTDDEEDDDVLCSCGKVHPPTFHQPWRVAEARAAEPEQATTQEAAVLPTGPSEPSEPSPMSTGMMGVPPSEAMNLAFKQHEPEEWELVDADEEEDESSLRRAEPHVA